MRPAVTGDRIHASFSVALVGTVSPCAIVHTSYYLFGAADTAAPTPPVEIGGVLREASTGIDAVRFEEEAGTLSSFSASVYYMR
jgi:hypothetical protein